MITWSIISALAPTITPPASVAFWMSTAWQEVVFKFHFFLLRLSASKVRNLLLPEISTHLQRWPTRWMYRPLTQEERCRCWRTLVIIIMIMVGSSSIYIMMFGLLTEFKIKLTPCAAHRPLPVVHWSLASITRAEGSLYIYRYGDQVCLIFCPT